MSVLLNARTRLASRPLVRALSCLAPLRPASHFASRLPCVQYTELLLPSRRCNGSSVGSALGAGVPGGITKLSDLAKVPLLMNETSVRVREIWLEKFSDSARAVAGVLAHEEYETFKQNSTACPMFIVPVPRGEGYLNLLWQVQGNRIIYLTVEAFQRGNTGNTDLGTVIFDDLLSSHQIALLHGEVQSDLLSKEEAAQLVRYTREAYVDPARFDWVKRFNQNPREFDYEEYQKAFRPLDRMHEK